MNKLFFCLLLLVAPFLSQAQFKTLLKKAKDKTTQRVENRIDKGVTKALDDMEEKILPTSTEGTTTPGKDITAGAPGETVKSYSKFDFVPGEKIIYAEDFAPDAPGELPLYWNSTGKGEVVTIEGHAGKWLKMFQNSTYLTGNKAAFDKNYTVEFDLLLQFNYKSHTLPLVYFGLLSSNDLGTTDNALLKELARFQMAEIMLRPYNNNTSKAGLRTLVEKKDFFRSTDQELSQFENYYNKVSHVSIQIQETRLRVWINSQKVFDLPKALSPDYVFNQLFFKIGNSGYLENAIGFYVSNIKVATGLPDTRHKLIEEGRFSTTGILFDVAAATIKPESNGILKEIADVLKSNPGIKVKIVGHTDSDGADVANLDLSKKRAEAVKSALVKDFGIEVAMIESDGKGESAPAGDNKTKEGRAQNRRVEFIKL